MKECCRFRLGTCVAPNNPQELEQFCKDLSREDKLTVVCKSCLKAVRISRREYMRVYTNARRAANPELRKKYDKSPKGRASQKRRRRTSVLKCRYGITQNDWDRMFEMQNGKCKICRMSSTSSKNSQKFLHVDHCHKTGKVRGLLCFNCNRNLGAFNDDPEIFERAISYLKGEL